jgi:hypothetical protein
MGKTGRPLMVFCTKWDDIWADCRGRGFENQSPHARTESQNAEQKRPFQQECALGLENLESKTLIWLAKINQLHEYQDDVVSLDGPLVEVKEKP